MEISAESVGSLNPIVSENMIEVFRQRMQSDKLITRINKLKEFKDEFKI